MKSKKAGRKAPKPKARPKPSNVVNLFDALKKSLTEDEGETAEAGAKPTSKPARRSTPATSARKKPGAKSKTT